MNELIDRMKRIEEGIPEDNKALMNMVDERLDKQVRMCFY